MAERMRSDAEREAAESDGKKAAESGEREVSVPEETTGESFSVRGENAEETSPALRRAREFADYIENDDSPETPAAPTVPENSGTRAKEESTDFATLVTKYGMAEAVDRAVAAITSPHELEQFVKTYELDMNAEEPDVAKVHLSWSDADRLRALARNWESTRRDLAWFHANYKTARPEDADRRMAEDAARDAEQERRAAAERPAPPPRKPRIEEVSAAALEHTVVPLGKRIAGAFRKWFGPKESDPEAMAMFMNTMERDMIKPQNAEMLRNLKERERAASSKGALQKEIRENLAKKRLEFESRVQQKGFDGVIAELEETATDPGEINDFWRAFEKELTKNQVDDLKQAAFTLINRQAEASREEMEKE